MPFRISKHGLNGSHSTWSTYSTWTYWPYRSRLVLLSYWFIPILCSRIQRPGNSFRGVTSRTYVQSKTTRQIRFMSPIWRMCFSFAATSTRLNGKMFTSNLKTKTLQLKKPTWTVTTKMDKFKSKYRVISSFFFSSLHEYMKLYIMIFFIFVFSFCQLNCNVSLYIYIYIYFILLIFSYNHWKFFRIF